MGEQSRQTRRWLQIVLVIVAMAAVPVTAADLSLVKPTESKSLYYSDGRIAVTFSLRPARIGSGYEGIAFTIRNLTTEEIEIDWNRTSIWLPTGQMSKVIHHGVRYVQAETILPPTVIPPGRMISDFVLPARSVYVSIMGWRVRPIDLQRGSQLGLYLAVQGSRIPRGYDFVFRANSAVTPAKTRDAIGRWSLGAVALMFAGILFRSSS